MLNHIKLPFYRLQKKIECKQFHLVKSNRKKSSKLGLESITPMNNSWVKDIFN